MKNLTLKILSHTIYRSSLISTYIHVEITSPQSKVCTVLGEKFILIWFVQKFDNMTINYHTYICLFVHTVTNRLFSVLYKQPVIWYRQRVIDRPQELLAPCP